MARKLTKEQQKKLILKIMALKDNLREALQAAKLTRVEYRAMQSSGFITESELTDAHLDYTDIVLASMNKLGLDGVEKPVIRYNKPVLGADGKQLFERQPDIAALKWLAERLLTMQQQQREAVVQDTIPAQYKLVIDARELEKSEFQAILRIAKAIDARKEAGIQPDTTMPIKASGKRKREPVSSNGV